MADVNMRELYNTNASVKAYVDRLCRTDRYTVNQVLDHALVKAVADQCIHPEDDTYTFGNVEPLSRLTNADMIRAMSDDELAGYMVECMNRFRSPYKGCVGDFDGVRDTR